MIPGIVLLLLPLLALPFHLFPSLRTHKWGKALLQKRLWASRAPTAKPTAAAATATAATAASSSSSPAVVAAYAKSLATNVGSKLGEWATAAWDTMGALRVGTAVVEGVVLLLLLGLTGHWCVCMCLCVCVGGGGVYA